VSAEAESRSAAVKAFIADFAEHGKRSPLETFLRGYVAGREAVKVEVRRVYDESTDNLARTAVLMRNAVDEEPAPRDAGAPSCATCGNSSSNHRMVGHPFTYPQSRDLPTTERQS
jgi:hypothetical protein